MRTIALVNHARYTIHVNHWSARGRFVVRELRGKRWNELRFLFLPQCMAAISGTGGFCSQNLFYGTARDSRRRYQRDN